MSRESRSSGPAVATRTPPRTALPLSLHCISGARAWDVESAMSHRNLRLASVGGIVRGPERPIAMQALPALWTHASKVRISTPMRRVWGLRPLRWLLYLAGTAPVLCLWGKPHGELVGLCEVERSEVSFCKECVRSWPKAPPRATLPLRKPSGPGPLPSRWTSARGDFYVVLGCVLSRLLPLHP